MKILHNVFSVGKSSYGLGQISVSLANAQLNAGYDTSIFSLSETNDLEWASSIHGYPINKFKRINSKNSDILTNILILNKLNQSNEFSDINIVHQHGIWSINSLATISLRKKNNIKTIIAPHGSLSELALEKSKIKKELALLTYEGANLKNASVLHATSSYEIEDFRRIGLKNPIAYINNGINFNELNMIGNKDKFLDKYKIPKDRKILLYLSRITPKKGLDMLLKAIFEIKNSFDEWILIIAGNDEFNYKSKVEGLISDLNLTNKVFIVEPQFGSAKYDIFAAADFFILPSYSEGSPMVVLDALASGTPTITTKSSSWEDLNLYECGYWVDIKQSAIEKALISMTNLSENELISKGEKAKDLILSKYLWDNIAKKTIELYYWLLTNSNIHKPEFIYLK